MVVGKICTDLLSRLLVVLGEFLIVFIRLNEVLAKLQRDKLLWLLKEICPKRQGFLNPDWTSWQRGIPETGPPFGDLHRT